MVSPCTAETSINHCKCGRTGCPTVCTGPYSKSSINPYYKPKVKSFKSYEKFITSKIRR